MMKFFFLLSRDFYHSPHEPVTREMGDIPEDSGKGSSQLFLVGEGGITG